MSLPPADREVIVDAINREPTAEEAALFENLWSEHCAYRSSRSLLTALDSEDESVLVGPGDDAAVVRLSDGWAVAMGIESHNHPSYVDPYDGAATGVGGIVRDILSMGAYPIALADCLYFGQFTDDHPRYLFEGVVEGISDYGNAIGVPTVTGSVEFHSEYSGNPLVNVGCVGLVPTDRIIRAAATDVGDKLVLVGNATGRDGLGGASFASEDLSEDAETADRPAVQVGDPYTEKLLIEANEALLEADIIQAARDLGAAGLGGATSEMVAQGGTGARIELDRVHQREPAMSPLEILLSESQERMCYSVQPDDVDALREITDRFELESSVIGEVTADNYVCLYEGETVVDVSAELLAEGAPLHERERLSQPTPDRDLPQGSLQDAFETVLQDPVTTSREWVYRQYDHEVGVRTAVPPGNDAAILAIREADTGLAISAGANPRWTSVAAYDGARGIALENATNLAVSGATPLAVVDCLNGGNPEKPAVYGGFADIVDGLADMCKALSVPVVGGNVSLYNDSATGPIPPTPTVLMIGTTDRFSAPPIRLSGSGSVCVVGDTHGHLGGSVYLQRCGGTDQFPNLPENPQDRISTLAEVVTDPTTTAAHDISHGGLAVTLAEMIGQSTGLSVNLPAGDTTRPAESIFAETPGRAVIETTDIDRVRRLAGESLPVTEIGQPTDTGELSITDGTKTVSIDYERLTEHRARIERTMD